MKNIHTFELLLVCLTILSKTGMSINYKQKIPRKITLIVECRALRRRQLALIHGTMHYALGVKINKRL